MSTMKQVAEMAQVSVATVSRVINDSGYVSPTLQTRVRTAMKQLRYQPSALARGLRKQETQTIGVMLPQLNNPFFATLAFAIEKTLFRHQYHCFICSAEEDRDKEDAYVQMMLRQRVDGVIVVPTGHSAQSIAQLLEGDIPVVFVDRDLPDLSASRVLADNRHGGELLVQHLLDLGHRHIAIISMPTYSEAVSQRLEGVTSALQAASIPIREPSFSTSLQQFESGYQCAMEMLQHSSRPSAIMALTDMLAIGVLHAAAQLGLQVPEDLSVTGFDDIPLAAQVLPELTTAAQPLYDMGETAAQVLLRHMRQPNAPLENIQLSTELKVRHSTSVPAACFRDKPLA